MSHLRTYKDLIVWQKGVLLVTEMYKLSSTFPSSEVYGLTSQMRRAAVSIPSNIAEGYARSSSKEYYHFLRIAYGSGLELETQIVIAKNIGFCKDASSYQTVDVLLEEVLKMLNSMTNKKTRYT